VAEHVRKPSIVDGELVRCSVSQLKTADVRIHGGCLRRWYFDKHDHLDDEAGDAAEDSTKCHTMAETYLTDGFEPAGTNNLERAFLAGKHLLPEPGTVFPEFHFDGIVSLAGVPFNGKLDVWDPMIREAGCGVRYPTVRDHKFHGDMTERALTGDQLERDVQMVGYGVVAAALAPEATHIDLGHFNYQKREPRPTPGARLVNRLVAVDVLLKRWDGWTETVKTMKQAAREAEAAAVPANTKACFAYGKKYACPHVERCAKLKSGTEKPMGWSAEELALFGKKPETVSVPAVQPEVQAPIADVAPPPKKSLIVDVAEGETEAEAAARAGLRPSAFVDDGPGFVDTKCEAGHNVGKRPPGSKIASVACPVCINQRAKAAGVLPPDAPVSDPQLAAACPKCEHEKNFQHKPEDCPKLNAPEKPAKRTRRTKAEMEAARAAAVVDEAVASSEAVFAQVSAERKTEMVEVPVDNRGNVVSVPREQLDNTIHGPIFPFDDDAMLRDEFAARALQGLLASAGFTSLAGAEVIATTAYILADAMLVARGQK
jgi:hypothetical protein